MASKVVEAVWKLVEPHCDELGFELVDVEYAKEGNRYILRLFIDKVGGITLDDCELLSRRIDPVLDAADPVPNSYYLEVSSPGLDRPLKRSEDYIRFAGCKVRVRLFVAINGSRNFQGILSGLHEGRIILQQEDKVIEIPLDQVAKANLIPSV